MRDLMTIGLASLLVLAACGEASELPPPPVIAPGEGFANLAGADSDRMIRMCDQTNVVADAGQLATFDDAQVINGTCMMSAIAVEMISRGDDPGQRCVAATAAMIREFKTRFPAHDARETAGRC